MVQKKKNVIDQGTAPLMLALIYACLAKLSSALLAPATPCIHMKGTMTVSPPLLSTTPILIQTPLQTMQECPALRCSHDIVDTKRC